jgi:hypothetical protein
MAGIEHLQKLLSDVVTVAVVAIKQSKEFADFAAEAKDLDTPEVVSLVSQAVMVEVPRIVEAIKA